MTKKKIFIGKEKQRTQGGPSSLGGPSSCSVVVQIAPQGCGIIGYDASGPQAEGHVKIRLFVKAPKYHLSREERACSFQMTLPGTWLFLLLCGALLVVECWS